ncbi:general substrate transporter [Biscogniauxia mediterranea]|nr:general substrate transporter [Biscogniauxia mediterranea]
MAQHQQKEMELRAHWRALSAATLVSLSSFQYGLDFGIIGGLQAMKPFLEVFGQQDPKSPIGWNISPVRQQLISSLMILGAFIASFSAGFTSRWLGRKTSLWVACIGVAVATIIMQLTRSIGALYAGRLIIGLANGLLMTHCQLYIQETLPAKYRGLGIAMFSYWISLGSLLGTVVDYPASKDPTRNAYIVPLGIVYIVPGIIAMGLFFIPESPRWLAGRGDMAAAEKSLKWLRPQMWPVTEELQEMEVALAAEAQLHSSTTFFSLFDDPIDRRRTIVAVLALTTQAGSGSMFVISYGTYFFQMANIGDSFQNSCILTGIGVLAMLINSALVTRFGYRRPTMMSGFALCGIAQLAIAAVYTVEPGTVKTGKAIVALSVIYIVGYNWMVAPYAWLSGGEIPSQRLRSYTFGLATAMGFLFAWLTTFTAPYFINPLALNWGPKYGYIWAPSCVICAVWIFFFLPEVKDRTLEEIDEMFEARVPARKFRGYQCTGTHAALQEKRQETRTEVVHEELK